MDMMPSSPIFPLVRMQEQYYWILAGILISLGIAHLIFRPATVKSPDRQRTKEAPGSNGWPIFGETFSFIAALQSSKGVYEFVRQRHHRYGDVFKTRIFGKTHVFLPGPEVAKLILKGEFQQFSKSYIRSMSDCVGDQSVFTVPENAHKNLRYVLGDLFTTEALAKFLERIDKLCINTLSHWKHHDHHSIRALDYTMDITFRIMCDKLMSLEGHEDQVQFLRRNADLISDGLLSIPIMFPGTRYYKGMKARERLLQFFSEAIARRRNGEEYHNDFLQSVLFKNHDNLEAERITDIQLKDNLLTLILAGYMSSGPSLMWAIKFLSDNPDVQEKLRVEQQMKSSEKAEGTPLTLEEVNGMTFLSKVVKESLRMSSVVAWIPRVALQDCNMAGFKIKKGWTVNIDANFIHFDPSIYKKPMEFNPCRFEYENPVPYSFLAFGGGARTCLGMNLAKLSMMLFLHRLVTTYRWKVVDNDPSLVPGLHFPILKNGCPISVEPVS